jgi:hypothetical protein
MSINISSGSTDRLVFDGGAYLTDLASFSIVCFVNRRGSMNGSGSRIFSIRGSGDADDIRIQVVTNNIPNFIIFRGGDQQLSATTALNQDQWYHIGVTYDQTTRHIYVDGTSENSSTSITGSINLKSGDDFNIGNGNPGSWNRSWNGDLAEFAIYDRALPASEMSALSDGFSPINMANGLVFYAPTTGALTTERDWVDGNVASDQTGITKAVHPRIIYPGFQQASTPAAVAAVARYLTLLGVGS